MFKLSKGIFSIWLLSSLTVCDPSYYGLNRCISMTRRSIPSWSCFTVCFYWTISSLASSIFWSMSSFSLFIYFISVSFSLMIQLQPSRSCLSLAISAFYLDTTIFIWDNSSIVYSCSLKMKGNERIISYCAIFMHLWHIPPFSSTRSL